ncbi:MAG: zinc-binding dehydrogenase [Candidatus Nitrosocaldaceae archaeon]
MKAIVLNKHGGVDELKYEEVDMPKSDNKALVKIHACSVNHLDLWVRMGVRGKSIKFPHIAGSDIAGELVNDIDGFKRGERVLIYPGLSCMKCRYCLEGNETLCKEFVIIGGLNDTQGGYAEYVSVPKYNLVRIPEWLTYEEAASINISYLTAWNMLEKIDAKGKTLLIYAAGSGVGSASIQFAKAMNARVITTIGNSSKRIYAEKLKPDLIIDRSIDDILGKIKEFGYVDAVIDHVGKSTWSISMEALRNGGALATCGATSGEDTNMNIRMLYNKQLTIYGIYLGSKKQLLAMLRFMEEHSIRPIIDKVMPLDEVKEAHKRMEESSHFGKIVLINKS